MNNDVNPYDIAGVRKAAEQRKQRGSAAVEPQPDTKIGLTTEELAAKGAALERMCNAKPAASAPAAPLDNALLAADKATIALLSAHIAAQNEVLSALCTKAGVDFTDVEAAKKALDRQTAELEQVRKAFRNYLAGAISKRAAEAALGEKGK